ncbi:MAG: 1-acyl-sn-glycerol-3-phosphate acyltransferase [Actinobacteria bacterium]|nr:1-acyl-sn-glycerol-3-phosphate acyltransferase [Actinomycetota bacterium]
MIYRIEVSGRENIPESGRLILCSNHLSYIDPLIIASYFSRHVYFMAKKEVFNRRILGGIVSFLNAFPVNRNSLDRKAIKNSIEILNSDEVLVIFPEGTRSLEGIIQEGRKGVGLISILSSNSPILPMALSRTNKIIQKPRKRIFFPKVKIIYGNLIDTTSIIKENSSKAAIEIIVDKTMSSIKELYERIK